MRITREELLNTPTKTRLEWLSLNRENAWSTLPSWPGENLASYIGGRSDP